MPWTAFPVDVECRAVVGCVVPAGAPVWESSVSARIKRCAMHAAALGFEVDDAAVDAARHAIEAKREGTAQRYATQPTFFEPARPREPFDPRMAAAGEGGRS